MYGDNIFFTGDSYADQILTKLVYWLEDNTDIQLNEFEKGVYVKFYDECNLEKFVELVFDEYPLAVDTPNFDYDIEYCWNEFIRKDRQAKEWVENFTPVIESSTFLDDLDAPTIAETIDGCEYVIDEFCSKNPIGKKLKAHDKKVMVDTIDNAEIGEFSNGYTWSADEFTDIVMTDYDGEHNRSDVFKEMNNYLKYAKNGKLVQTWVTDYEDFEVCVLYSIDLEEIAKNAL